MQFGNKLNSLLGARNMTPADLVRLTGIPKATISRYLRDGQPSWPYAVLIANALHVSLDTLADRSIQHSRITDNIIDSCDQLNTKGQKKVLEYTQDLVSSGRYSIQPQQVNVGRENIDIRAAGNA